MNFNATFSAGIERLAASLQSRGIDPTPVAICDVLWQHDPRMTPSMVLQYLQRWHRELYPVDLKASFHRSGTKLCPRDR